jgi:hypothetical protein
LELDDEASYVRVEVTGGTFSTLSNSPHSHASLHAHRVCNALVFGLVLLGFAFLRRQGDADALLGTGMYINGLGQTPVEEEEDDG